MNRLRSLTVTMAVGIAAGCSTVETTQPRLERVEVSFARVPRQPLSSPDTISLAAVVRDRSGTPVNDAVVTWSVTTDGKAKAAESAGSISPTGPRTALLKVGAGRVVIVASTLPDDRSGTFSGGLTINFGLPRPSLFLWSRETGFTRIVSPPGADLYPAGINDLGEVVGQASGTDGGAFVWSPSTGFKYLDSAGVPASLAVAINSSGSVTGWTWGGASPYRAFVWNRNSGLTIVPELIGKQLAYEGRSINSSGEIAGRIIGDTTFAAFRWSPRAGGQILRGSADGPRTEAVAINDSGQVVGYDGVWGYWDPVLDRRNAILWNPNGDRAEIAPGCNRQCDIDVAALNNRGEVAGTLDKRAFRWNASGGITTMPGPGVTRARGINDAGDIIVALLADSQMYGKAALWTARGDVIELGLPAGATFIYPSAINNRGVVVGTVR